MAGIALRGEHMAGERMVATAVDSFSRASEFAMAMADFKAIQNSSRWGRRLGFSGCTVDLCASQKTAKCKKYYSRFGLGEGSLGDLRTQPLDKGDLHYVCPPIPLIEFTLRRLLEEKIAAVVVVPLWIGREWNLWIRQRALDIDVLPWRSHPALWLDLADRKAKRHRMASQWQWMIAILDFREGELVRQQPLEAPLRKKDLRTKQEALRDFVKMQAQWRADPVPGGQGYGKGRKRAPPRIRWKRGRRSMTWVRPPLHYEVFRVLSLCGGIGTAGLVLKRLFKKFKVQCVLEVLEIEYCKEAKCIAQALVGSELKCLQPEDLWDWMDDEEVSLRKLRAYGTIHWVEAGFSCQDMSVANRKGRGLLGEKSSVFFVIQWFIKVLQGWYDSEFMAECTVFEKKFPKDWRFVCATLGVKPEKLEAARTAAVRRLRSFWCSYPLVQFDQQVADPLDYLEAGRRPLEKWSDKMPTIMAAGPRSWNMQGCVVEEVEGRSTVGPLRITEAERLQGLWEDATKVRDQKGEWLEEKARWAGVGNMIHVHSMMQVVASLMVCKGFVTREDVRHYLPCNLVGDGPMATLREKCAMWSGELDECLARQASAAQARREDKTPAAAKVHQRLKVTGHPMKVPTPKQQTRRRELPESLKARVQAGGKCSPPGLVKFESVYDQVDEKGVPQLTTMTRKVGEGLKIPQGKSHAEGMAAIARDFLILSRAEGTWKSYAAWFGVFEVWCDIYGVNPFQRDLEQVAGVLQLAITDMFYHGNYSPRTLDIIVSAVCSRLKHAGRESLRKFEEIKQILEGMQRKMGVATLKKAAITDEHVAALLQVPYPEWKGSLAQLKWDQCIAFIILGWACFLRKSELLNLQLCDLTWAEAKLEVLIRKTKNDQKIETRVTPFFYSEQQEGKCLLKIVEHHLKLLHGSLAKKEGCTKAVYPTRQCEQCDPVFPRILCEKIKMLPIVPSQLPKILKAAFKYLEECDKVEPELWRKISCSSWRRGGNTIAAAEGVRLAVRQKAGRWRAEATVGEYEGEAPGDDQQVSRALQARVNAVLQKGSMG